MHRKTLLFGFINMKTFMARPIFNNTHFGTPVQLGDIWQITKYSMLPGFLVPVALGKIWKCAKPLIMLSSTTILSETNSKSSSNSSTKYDQLAPMTQRSFFPKLETRTLHAAVLWFLWYQVLDQYTVCLLPPFSCWELQWVPCSSMHWCPLPAPLVGW